MLELQDVVLRQDSFHLSADFTLDEGGFTAIIGPSGAGKSTLLAAVAGFLRPESGHIAWRGRDITDIAPGDRPVSIIFQDHNLFPHLDIRTNVILGRSTARRPPDDAIAAADDALAHVGLRGMGGRKPAELSGGQQSRAALARVLLSDRPLLLLDEPFAALGPALRREMLDLTKTLARERGATVLIVTHDPEDARRYAEKLIFVDDGMAHSPVQTTTALTDPSPALASYLGT